MPKKTTTKYLENQFFQSGESLDFRYSVCRDNEKYSSFKQWIEKSWCVYRPFCGDRIKEFFNNAKSNFCGQIWHLYLANLFIKNGFQLLQTGSGQPDLCIRHEDRKIWIEAVNVTVGLGPDRAPNDDFYSGINGYFQPQDSSIQLRLSSVFSVKRARIEEHISSGLIAEKDLCLIAVNSGDIPLSFFTTDYSNMFKVLYKVKGTHYSVDPETYEGAFVISKHDSLTKVSGEMFPIGYFEDSKNQRVTGVIFCPENIWKMNMDSGDGVEVIENLNSRDRVPNRLLNCFGGKWVVKDGGMFLESEAI